MIKILFEDNDSYPTSKAIKEVLGENVEFSNGNLNLNYKMKELVSDGNYVIAFVDLVPDNFNTLAIFEECSYMIKQDSLPCIIIPIPCLEYFLIRAFSKFLRCDYKLIKYVEDYSPEYKCLSNLPSMVTSFERYCKYVFNQYKKSCMGIPKKYNKNEGNEGRVSLFFNNECGIDNYFCKNCILGYTSDGLPLSVQDKAWRFLYEIPALPEDLIGEFSAVKGFFQEVQEYYIKLYNEAVHHFSLYDNVRYIEIENIIDNNLEPSDSNNDYDSGSDKTYAEGVHPFERDHNSI